MKYFLSFSLILTSQLWAYGPEQDLLVDSIIDGDTRNQVTNHKDPVSLAVGLVSYGGGFCTGTLITPRHVLTNGHCVAYGDKTPYKMRSASSFTFTPGKLSRTDASHGVYKAVMVQTFMQWVTTGNVDYDVAVIKLDRPVKGIRPIALHLQRTAANFKDFNLTINGYSSLKPFGTQWVGTGLYERRSGKNSFLHTIDTLPGTSGALVRKRMGNSWIGIGIHRGSQDNPAEGGLFNRAVMFNQTVFNTIVQWIRK